MKWRGAILAAAASVCLSPAPAQRGDPNEQAAIKGTETRAGRSAQWIYAQHKKLNAAIAALPPQRPGTVDAYVVSIGLDADPVFGREAAEASRVLARRYDAQGRTILLAAGGGAGPDAAANGSPGNLAIALGGVAEKMDLNEDVLILFATTHGAPRIGLAFNDGEFGQGMIAPARLTEMLKGLGFKRRLLIISACFSGEFVPPLADADTVIVTAASAINTSFGCAATNDWTFFGDALMNNALRQPAPFDAAVSQAFDLVARWELMKGAPPSVPQYHRGANAGMWLDALEARMPRDASARVGRPSIMGN